jgi:hypothetical protein
VADGTSGAGALAAGGLAGALGAAADGRVVAVVAALAALAGLACGAVPALAAGRHDLAAVLAGLAGGRAGRPRAARLRAALLATQVALTATLLVGAGLFARSLARVDGLALGVDVDRLLVVRVNGQDAGLSEAAVDTLLGRLADRARGVPGVTAVSRAHTVPFVSAWRTRFYVPGRDPERWGNEGGGRYNLLSTFVGPEYREAVGLTLLAGRWLAASDRAGAEPVAVVNDALVREVWPGAGPAAGPSAALGQCLQLMTPDAPCRRVVGVVRAARAEGVFEEPPSQFYVPLDQPQRGEVATALLVRTGAGAALTAAAVRRALQPLAPEAATSRRGRSPRRWSRRAAPGDSARRCSAPSGHSRSPWPRPACTAW